MMIQPWLECSIHWGICYIVCAAKAIRESWLRDTPGTHLNPHTSISLSLSCFGSSLPSPQRCSKALSSVGWRTHRQPRRHLTPHFAYPENWWIFIFLGSAGVWLWAIKRASLLDEESSLLGDTLGFFLEERFKGSHKRWPSLCCQSSLCLEVCGRVEASQNSSNFRNTYPDTDLQGRCYFHLDIFSFGTVASVFGGSSRLQWARHAQHAKCLEITQNRARFQYRVIKLPLGLKIEQVKKGRKKDFEFRSSSRHVNARNYSENEFCMMRQGFKCVSWDIEHKHKVGLD